MKFQIVLVWLLSLMDTVAFGAASLLKIEQGGIGCARMELRKIDGGNLKSHFVNQCWDMNYLFTVGRPKRESEPPPVSNPWSKGVDFQKKELQALPWLGDTAQDFAIGDNSLCAILEDASVECVGDGYTNVGLRVPNWHHNVIDENNPNEEYRQSYIERPVKISINRERALSIATGSPHYFGRGLMYCVGTQEGNVYCWNAIGVSEKLRQKAFKHSKINSESSSISFSEESKKYWQRPYRPRKFVLGSPVKSLSVQDRDFCALLENGKAKCFSLSNQSLLFTAKDKETLFLLMGTLKNQLGLKLRDTDLLSYEETLDLSNPVFDFHFGKNAVDVKSFPSQTCVVFDDGTATCWGKSNFLNQAIASSEYGVGFLPWEIWGLWEKLNENQAKATFDNAFARGYGFPKYQRLNIKSQQQRVVRVFFDRGTIQSLNGDNEGVCFLLSPGADDGRNLKCSHLQKGGAAMEGEDWIDHLPWVETPLPVTNIVIATAGASYLSPGVCVQFVNGAAKCAPSLEEIINEREIPFLSF